MNSRKEKEEIISKMMKNSIKIPKKLKKVM